MLRRKSKEKTRKSKRKNDDFDELLVTERVVDVPLGVATHIGTRNYQQDAYAIPSTDLMNSCNKNIFVISDGMGGMKGGEKASKISAEVVLEDFYKSGSNKHPPEFFNEEIQKIDRLVSELEDENGNPIESGATFISIIIEENKMYWASVGDSRIYLIRNNDITAFNEDHNRYRRLKEHVKAGLMTQEEADADVNKDALTSYIGINGVDLIDMNDEQFILQENDVILLCSDGLYKSLTEERIKNIIVQLIENISLAAKILVDTAINNRPKGQDNTTVILFKYNNK